MSNRPFGEGHWDKAPQWILLTWCSYGEMSPRVSLTVYRTSWCPGVWWWRQHSSHERLGQEVFLGNLLVASKSKFIRNFILGPPLQSIGTTECIQRNSFKLVRGFRTLLKEEPGMGNCNLSWKAEVCPCGRRTVLIFCKLPWVDVETKLTKGQTLWLTC